MEVLLPLRALALYCAGSSVSRARAAPGLDCACSAYVQVAVALAAAASGIGCWCCLASASSTEVNCGALTTTLRQAAWWTCAVVGVVAAVGVSGGWCAVRATRVCACTCSTGIHRRRNFDRVCHYLRSHQHGAAVHGAVDERE